MRSTTTRVFRSAAAFSRRSALFHNAHRCFASSYPAHEVVGLPSLSPTMEFGNLSAWNMKEGDKISAGDIICQIETDKAVVDYEAQDDTYLARILVPAGTENIAVGQPIMVTCEEEEDVVKFKDFQPDSSVQASPKSSENPPPPAPVVPQDFLITSQRIEKPSPVPSIPTQVAPTPAPVPPKTNHPAPAALPSLSPLSSAEKWGHGFKKSPLWFSLVKQQQAYLDLYGITGTTPVSSK